MSCIRCCHRIAGAGGSCVCACICRLIAQLHDELLYEVEDSQVAQFAGEFTTSIINDLNELSHAKQLYNKEHNKKKIDVDIKTKTSFGKFK